MIHYSKCLKYCVCLNIEMNKNLMSWLWSRFFFRRDQFHGTYTDFILEHQCWNYFLGSRVERIIRSDFRPQAVWIQNWAECNPHCLNKKIFLEKYFNFNTLIVDWIPRNLKNFISKLKFSFSRKKSWKWQLGRISGFWRIHAIYEFRHFSEICPSGAGYLREK